MVRIRIKPEMQDSSSDIPDAEKKTLLVTEWTVIKKLCEITVLL